MPANGDQVKSSLESVQHFDLPWEIRVDHTKAKYRYYIKGRLQWQK